MDIISNAEVAPNMQRIKEFITGEAYTLWCDLTAYIENTFASKPQIMYSVCAAKPGWNVKYKKSGRALCTLYPEKNGFVALVVLSENDQYVFDMEQPAYSEYLCDLYDHCKPLGSTKWLMISVTTKDILKDVIMLLHLKLNKNK